MGETFVMQCPVCGTVNGPGRFYCGGCAGVVGVVCPACLVVNEPIHRFCGRCAHDLLATSAAFAAPALPGGTDPSASSPPTADGATPAPPVTPVVQGSLARDLQDLDDLVSSQPATARDETARTAVEDVTQCDVDSFFLRLAREGVVEIPAATPSGRLQKLTRDTP